MHHGTSLSRSQANSPKNISERLPASAALGEQGRTPLERDTASRGLSGACTATTQLKPQSPAPGLHSTPSRPDPVRLSSGGFTPGRRHAPAGGSGQTLRPVVRTCSEEPVGKPRFLRIGRRR